STFGWRFPSLFQTSFQSLVAVDGQRQVPSDSQGAHLRVGWCDLRDVFCRGGVRLRPVLFRERQDRMRRLIQGTLAAVVLMLAGCNKLNFKEFTSEEGKFSILMPGDPERKTQRIRGLEMVMYGMNVKNGAYVVGYMDAPGRPLSLDGAIQNVTNEHNGKISSTKDFTLEGYTGKEFEIESKEPKGYISGRVIVVKDRLYTFQAAGTNAKLSNSDVRKFLDSFKLLK